MKAINHTRTIMLVLSAFVFSAVGLAQDVKPPDGQPPEAQRPGANQPMDVRGNVLRQLDLSREQIQQIRRVNMERKPVMDEAQKRFREANRALDEAIYADQVNDSDVQTRLKEVQTAQAEVAKIRFTSELAIRRILTPEQLVRFRDLRARFEQVRKNFEERRPGNGDRPPNRQMPGSDARPPQDTRMPGQRFSRPKQQRRQF